MKTGTRLPVWRYEVQAAAMVPLAAMLGDPNPIHLDPAAVAAAGLGDRVINQGPANLAYIVNMLGEALPGYRLEKLDSRFLANVRDGDVVEAHATVIEETGDRVICDLWLDIQGAGPAVRGSATLVRR